MVNDTESLSEGHNIFLSWSMGRSKVVAEAFKRFIAAVNNDARPWMSKGGLEPGVMFFTEINKKLDLRIGIVFVTPENMGRPWLNFEAGALLKSVRQRSGEKAPTEQDWAYVVLVGFEGQLPAGHPLHPLQSAPATREGIWEVVQSINGRLDRKRSDEDLKYTFNVTWPDLEKVIMDLPPPEEAQPVSEVDGATREILDVVRSLQPRDDTKVRMGSQR